MSKEYAVISVSDKDGLVELGKKFDEFGVEILSTGGTYNHLIKADVPATKVSEYTGASEIMGGRVKTLHPKIYAGILERRDVETDAAEIKEEGYGDGKTNFIIVNLYPFEKTVATPNATHAEIIENIDIGGSTLIRAAAKNYRWVCVIVDPADYALLIAELEANNGSTTLEFRKKMAVKAFILSSNYELAIGRYLSDGEFDGFTGLKVAKLKYGENPQQEEGAASFTFNTKDPLAFDKFKIVDGAPNGFINNTDLKREVDAGARIATTIRTNFPDKENCYICLGVKHGNTCGAGISFTDPLVAVKRMIEGNPLAISGGFILTNFDIDLEIANILRTHLVVKGGMKRIFDGIITPSISDDAIVRLRRLDGGYRILVNPALDNLQIDTARQFCYLRGGFQIQPANEFILNLENPHKDLQVSGKLTDQQRLDVFLAKALCDESTSNTILAVRDGMLLANGTCRPSRVSAGRGCINEAISNNLNLEGSVLASDSFWPALDGPQEAIDAGVSVVVTTSGSKADKKVFPLFADAGVTVVTIPNTVGRGFKGHN